MYQFQQVQQHFHPRSIQIFSFLQLCLILLLLDLKRIIIVIIIVIIHGKSSRLYEIIYQQGKTFSC